MDRIQKQRLQRGSLLWSLAVVACTSSTADTAEITSWIEMSNWRQSLEEDLFPEHQPDTIDCPSNGFRVEIDQLEIQTDICNYAVVEWQTQMALPARTTLEALVLHTGLWAPEPSNAHFALSIEGQLFWEAFPPIPSDTEFFFDEAEWAEAIPEGATVQLHLHNHGANDWKLGYFQPANP